MSDLVGSQIVGFLMHRLIFIFQGFTENLHALFCLAENAVGPLSYRPDDILTMYSGK